ncbi:hypothetical protein [Paenibacillus andongensis]|uniref:hypothetical protein n=1 Tax=Paenibacillus andongensis TaxID=2975482 RepID=UPI0021BB4B06|nr:hypothetical protein [Paenibacillus andongensis]
MEVYVLERLPNPIILKKLMKIQASLNIILCEDEWLRYHRFVQDWDEGVCMAKIDNGAGFHTPENFVEFAEGYFELSHQIDDDTLDSVSSMAGSYIFEVARRNYGGQYIWG